jgi:hypothetical protein
MIPAIVAAGAGVVLVVKFIKSILVKYVGFAFILSAQFAITASTIAFVIVFYTFTITALVSIYNKGIEIFTYATTSSSGILSCLFGYSQCIGLAPALQNGFTMAYGVLSTVVIFHLLKFTFSAMKIIANEFFKLGLLLGQMLK